MFKVLLIGCAVIVVLNVYLFFKRKYQFWKTIGVPFIEPFLIFGNISEMLKCKIHFGVMLKQLYNKMKDNHDYCGIYFLYRPVLLVLSPEFAKTILVRDFSYFMDRGMYSNEQIDPLSGNLFFMNGHQWKTMRSKITPIFTSSKLKLMFNTIIRVGNQLTGFLEPHANMESDVEIRDLIGRFMTDVIGSCAFGFECNTIENKNSKFREMGRKMLNFPKTKTVKLMVAIMYPNAAKLFGVRFNDEDVSDFFMDVVRDTINHRKESGMKRIDFIQFLIDLKVDSKSESDGLSFLEIATQMFVLFFAGFETAATTLTFALHSLANDKDIQDKARRSISEVLEKYNGEWCYDSVMEMTFIDQVIEETLRLYTTVSNLQRICVKDYTLPNGSILPKDTTVIIPTLAFNHDPDMFPNPMKFDPDRFNDENKRTRHPFSSLPFGEGPRFCIGQRLGQLQTKLGLALLLHKFEFNFCSKTEYPIKIEPLNLVYGPSGDVWLNVKECCSNN